MKKTFFIWLLLVLSQTETICQNKYNDSLKQKLAFLEEDTSKVNLLYHLAALYTFSYPDSGAIYAKKGFQLAQKLKYKFGEASCLGSLCLNLTFLGDYINALGFGLKALPIFEDLQDTTSLIWTNIQIMNCYRYLEDYDQALIYGYKAKRLFRFAHPDSGQISVGLALIGSAYEKKNQLDSALYYAQKAFSWDKNWTGVYHDMGVIYTRIGRVIWR
jgi:tetratricopeptide (TPR) repeat protein